MQEILTGSFLPPGQASCACPESLVIVTWNINKGLKLRRVIDFLATTQADILILQEVDLNAKRTHCLNIAEEIARQLKLAYVFGMEFEEITQGSRESRAFEGQATLSRWPIRKSRLIRFREQSGFWRPRWFIPNTWPFQERKGGRIVLVSEIDIPGYRPLIYNLHLESRGDTWLRLCQLVESLTDCVYQEPERSLILAGDFNLDAMQAAPIALLAGGHFRIVLVRREEVNGQKRGSKHRAHTIDWAFTRGPIYADNGRMHAGTGASDHDPISFNVSVCPVL